MRPSITLHRQLEDCCLKKEKTKMSNAVFIVTNEESCPYYDLGDEIKAESGSLSISALKPVCLYLSEKIKEIVETPDSIRKTSLFNSPQLKFNEQPTLFDCGGCTGSIRYQFKQEKDYVTLQMKLLMNSIEVRKQKHLARYYNQMRSLEIFKSLEDDALKELILLLEFKAVPPQKVLLEKDSPGTHLYIIISGEVNVVADDGTKISKIHSGDIFGEVSLLSGEPHSNSLHTVTVTQAALLSIKNFRQILKMHPPLQIFLFKLLINRVQLMALRAGNIASGMSGDLEEIQVVDLLQLIHTSKKTGHIDIGCVDGRGQVFFNEGEIIYAHYAQLEGKEAVFAILGIKNGQFSYHRDMVEDTKVYLPLGDFMGLIMEGVQKIDEHHSH
jgi:CRP-like cAMP-binding protein